MASSDKVADTVLHVLVVAAPTSGAGKTTVSCGLIATYASRGYDVRCFKCGPDFLDGMHHSAALAAGRRMRNNVHCEDETETTTTPSSSEEDRTANLDGWMQGCHEEVLSTFARHTQPRRWQTNSGNSNGNIVVCIIEGVMGLHDSRNGISDDGSTAQIAKILRAPVLLVVDASMCARSVAAIALGQALFDPHVRLGGVLANKIAGSKDCAHKQWIQEAIESTPALADSGTGQPVRFFGGLPNDKECSIPERHLGLHMPHEEEVTTFRRFERLVALMEENLDLDGILELGRTTSFHSTATSSICQSATTTATPATTKLSSLGALSSSPKVEIRCRIGVAHDAAFCFYYVDNLHLLRMAGAELVPFSPLKSKKLPPNLDGLYFGGGYPELYADDLENNRDLRNDIRSFCNSGAAVLAECGGLMYLCDYMVVAAAGGGASKKENDFRPRKMCGVFSGLGTRMTRHCHMYYATIQIAKENPIFGQGNDADNDIGGGDCRSSEEEIILSTRGQEFHYSEVIVDNDDGGGGGRGGLSPSISTSTILITPERPSAKPIPGGYAYRNTFASYLHFFFASKRTCHKSNQATTMETKGNLADNFVQSVIRSSPSRKAMAVSFASAATEIIFALKEEACLAGVTSICDYPASAPHSPRQVMCRSRIDASTMTSEQVRDAVEQLKLEQRQRMADGKDNDCYPPGHWLIDLNALKDARPNIAFVQNTCNVCDANKDDVLYALKKVDLLSDCRIVQVAPSTLEEMFLSIVDVGSALDVKGKAVNLVLGLRARLDYIKTKLDLKGSKHRPRVLSLEGLAPLCTGGGWLPDIKNLAGCEDALRDIGGCPPRILEWSDVTSADPDVLLISPCSASPMRTMNELHLLSSSPEFWSLRCVRKGNVYILDHSKYSRPGPRLVDGCEMLSALLNGVEFDLEITKKWEKEAYKYECDVTENLGGSNPITHCTTEFAQRFKPCFGEAILQKKAHTAPSRNLMSKCQVTRCTIPGFALPEDRSAHVLVSFNAEQHHGGDSILLFGGESSNGTRLSDVWKLTPPSKGWYEALSKDDGAPSEIPRLHLSPTWERVRYGKIHGEDVLPRSNHAAVVCGNEYLLVFGGWGESNVDPLSNCQLLHLETFCWTNCSVRGGIEPPARGNPTLVYFSSINSAILFGGWDGKRRYNDVWQLDMKEWTWNELRYTERGKIPAPRTDHSAVKWMFKSRGINEKMIVFGGSIEGEIGSTSELWLLEQLPAVNGSACGEWRWSRITTMGPAPPPRTSHAAAMIGDGDSAKMVVCGGTDASAGCGKTGILRDAWVLSLGSGPGGYIGRWQILDWRGGIERCRHSVVAVGTSLVVAVWGGYDGASTISDDANVYLGTTATDGDGKPSFFQTTSKSQGRKKQNLQDRWEAEIPVSVHDLPREELEKAKSSTLPGALERALHKFAVANGKDTYIDPSSGYSVFTRLYLKRRECCGNGCRHCPYGHKNVPGRKREKNGFQEDKESSRSLDW